MTPMSRQISNEHVIRIPQSERTTTDEFIHDFHISVISGINQKNEKLELCPPGLLVAIDAYNPKLWQAPLAKSKASEQLHSGASRVIPLPSEGTADKIYVRRLHRQDLTCCLPVLRQQQLPPRLPPRPPLRPFPLPTLSAPPPKLPFGCYT